MAFRTRPPHLNQVTFDEGFWRRRREVNRRVTLPLQYQRSRTRIEAMKLGWTPDSPTPRPHCFWDSDVAKWIEASAYSMATHPDARLKRKVDRVVRLIEAAQMPDGYFNSYYQQVEPDKRWTNLRDMHELYTAGHLIEAAVALHQSTGSERLLRVMCRFADHIDRTFGRATGKKRGYSGHEEIELALVKLYHATGERRYLHLASYFVDERGTQPHYFDREARARGEKPKPGRKPTHDYCQAHLPVREQAEAVGHAVRALYLYAGMADVAAETGDKALLTACQRLWRNITTRRMYVHGGVGSQHLGEKFTVDYDLPNEQAYAETCATIALVFFAQRMLNLTGDGQYADVMERCLYNGTISGVSLTGDRFFYDNYLASHPPYHQHANRKSPDRQEWFGCACCPPNIARLLTSLGRYVYSTAPRGVMVNLFAAGQLTAELGGTPVTLRQSTDYPWDGRVKLEVMPKRPATFAVAVRLPGWCGEPTMKLNGRAVDLAVAVKKGYARISREWSTGDRIELHLPMPVRQIEAHPHVRQDAGKVAIQRGPVVYCLEEVDNGKNLGAIALPADARLTARYDPKLLGGVVAITGKAQRLDATDWKDTLYRPAGHTRRRTVTIKAVPYYAWANRKSGEMLVWMNRA